MMDANIVQGKLLNELKHHLVLIQHDGRFLMTCIGVWLTPVELIELGTEMVQAGTDALSAQKKDGH